MSWICLLSVFKTGFATLLRRPCSSILYLLCSCTVTVWFVKLGGNPDPLHNLNDIRQAVADLSKAIPDPAPMVEIFITMAQEVRFLSLAQKISKKENALLVAASRKAKVGEVLSKLTNPMS